MASSWEVLQGNKCSNPAAVRKETNNSVLQELENAGIEGGS